MAKRRRPPMGIVVILVSLALGPWSARADIDDLCKKTQCRRELCLTPKITGVMLFSNITPGGTVAVKGCGFGEKGTFRLVLTDHKGGPELVWLDVIDWTDQLVSGTIPSVVVRVADQTGRLVVVTKTAKKSNEVPVGFRATRTVKRLPMSDVQLAFCSPEADKDVCNGKVASTTPVCFAPLGSDMGRTASGRHFTCHDWFGDDSGTDRYVAALKNGWTFHSHTWKEVTERNGVPDPCSKVHPTGLKFGGNAITVSVDWITCNYQGLVTYDLDLFITGFAGVPHQ